jgi:hypothetical protein
VAEGGIVVISEADNLCLDASDERALGMPSAQYGEESVSGLMVIMDR